MRTIEESIRKKRKHHLSQENTFRLSYKKLSSWLWKLAVDLSEEEKKLLKNAVSFIRN